MFAGRTTDRWARALLGVAVLLLGPSPPALAALQGITVTGVQLASGAVGAGARVAVARQIDISGRSPERCRPVLDRISTQGVDIDINLKVAPNACDDTRTVPFHLLVDPARSGAAALLTNQVYRVRTYVDDGGSPLLAGFALLDTHGSDSAATPENGFWWSEANAETGPAANANGASIEVQDRQLAISLLGFTDTGAANWYFGSTRIAGRVARVALTQLANGDAPFAPAGSVPSAQEGPRLELEFLSPTQARAYLVRSGPGGDSEVRALTLSRSRFATGTIGTGWAGTWVLVPDDNGPARVFEFSDPSSHDAETFHLTDAANDASLDCRLIAGTQHPNSCTLSAAAQALADFDQVGLDHLTGRSSNGARMRMLRVPR